MRSKKPAEAKRAALPRAADFSKGFHKDWERPGRSGRFDLKRLEEVMLLLIANDAPLGPEWFDHALKGDWADHRECHVGGVDEQEIAADDRQITFVRAGTHADLFEG